MEASRIVREIEKVTPSGTVAYATIWGSGEFAIPQDGIEWWRDYPSNECMFLPAGGESQRFRTETTGGWIYFILAADAIKIGTSIVP